MVEIMAAAPLGGAVSKLTCCIEIIDKIVELVSIARDNDGHCRHILRQTEVIKAIFNDLEGVSLSDAVKTSVDFVHEKLTNCDEYMDEMLDREFCVPRQLLHARKYRRDLCRLKSELDSSVSTFTAALGSQSIRQQQGINHSGNIEQTGPIVGRPLNLKVSKRAQNRIKLCWNIPTEKAKNISHYEVYHRRRWKKWAEPETTTNVHHVVKELSADTKYWFRVRAVDNDGYYGRYSEDIPAETKFSKLARGLITTGAAIGGTLAAPFLPGVAAAVAIAGSESITEERTVAVAVVGAISTVTTTLMPPVCSSLYDT